MLCKCMKNERCVNRCFVDQFRVIGNLPNPGMQTKLCHLVLEWKPPKCKLQSVESTPGVGAGEGECQRWHHLALHKAGSIRDGSRPGHSCGRVSESGHKRDV